MDLDDMKLARETIKVCLQIFPRTIAILLLAEGQAAASEGGDYVDLPPLSF